MGMTDRQFDTHLIVLLRDLKRIRDNLLEKGITEKELEKMIEDLEIQLKRP